MLSIDTRLLSGVADRLYGEIWIKRYPSKLREVTPVGLSLSRQCLRYRPITGTWWLGYVCLWFCVWQYSIAFSSFCSVMAKFHRIQQVGNLLKTWFSTRFPTCWKPAADKSLTSWSQKPVFDKLDLSQHVEIDLAGFRQVSNFCVEMQVLSRIEAVEFRNDNDQTRPDFFTRKYWNDATVTSYTHVNMCVEHTILRSVSQVLFIIHTECFLFRLVSRRTAADHDNSVEHNTMTSSSSPRAIVSIILGHVAQNKARLESRG